MLSRHALFASILFGPLALAGAERATVKTEAAQVYSQQRSSTEEIVTTLKRGDAVFVEMTFSSAEGNWCEVAGPAGSGIRGFMRCGDLERSQAAGRSTATYIPDAPPSTPAVAANAVAPQNRAAPPSLAAAAGEDYLRPIRQWTQMFGFSADQQATLSKLAVRMGVTACRERIEGHMKAYEPELTAPAGTVPRQRLEQMVDDFNRFAHPCLMKQLQLLERLPAMMTPEQRADTKRLAAFKNDLARQREILTSADTYPGIATGR